MSLILGIVKDGFIAGRLTMNANRYYLIVIEQINKQ